MQTPRAQIGNQTSRATTSQKVPRIFVPQKNMLVTDSIDADAPIDADALVDAGTTYVFAQGGGPGIVVVKPRPNVRQAVPRNTVVRPTPVSSVNQAIPRPGQSLTIPRPDVGGKMKPVPQIKNVIPRIEVGDVPR